MIFAMTKRKYSDQDFVEAVKNNISIRGVLESLGLATAGGSYKLFHKRVKTLNLSLSHFTGQGHLKGKTHDWNPKFPLEEVLVENSNYSIASLRKRLIKEKLLENKCNRCGLSEWMEEKLSLHLDHINGYNTDNRLENLRFLCPNCHSQTPTYCGRNKGKIKNGT
jgi:Zn finger protein HypA/HybF involved in hydrogenase expression